MEKVTEFLKDLETKYDIKVLYAAETGPKAWGVHFNEDEDNLAIHFIFKYNDRKKYISLKPLQEVIEQTYEGLYNFHGWDIKKALVNIKAMNSNIVELIYSPVVYYNNAEINFREKAETLILSQNRKVPLIFYYIALTEKIYKENFKDKIEVSIQNYLDVIRTAAIAEWLIQNKSKKFFEMNFQAVLNDLNKDLVFYELLENKNKLGNIERLNRLENIHIGGY